MADNPYEALLSGPTEAAPGPAPSANPPTANPPAANPYADLLGTPAEAPKAAPVTQSEPQEQPSGYVERTVGLTPYKSGTPDLASTEDRGNNLQDVPANALKDMGDFAQGMGALGSAAIGRARENLSDTGKLLMNPLSLGEVMKGQDIRNAADANTALHTVDGALQDYHNRYIAPMERGDLKAIGQQLVHHPVNSFLDLAPFLKGAGDAAGMIPKAAQGAARTLGGQEAVNRLTRMSGSVQKTIDRGLSGTPIGELADRATTYNMMRDTLRGADREYQSYLTGAVRKIDQAYRQVPDFVKPFLIEGSEGTNRIARNMVSNLQTVKNFYDTVNEFSDNLTEKLKKNGLLSEEDAIKARYGPSFQALMHKLGKPIKAAQLGDYTDALNKFKKRLDKLGIKPGYWGLAQKKEVEKFLEHEAHRPIMDQPKRSQTSFLKAREQAQIVEHPGTSGNVRTKLRNPAVHAEDARDVAVDRILRAARVLHIKEALDELVRNPLFSAKQKGWVAIKMDKLLEGTAKQAGMNEGAITRILADVQKEIYLPLHEAWYDKLNRVMNNLGPVPELYSWAAQTFKWLTLGPDIFWGAMQFAQNGLLYGWFTLKRPQDLNNALLSLAITMHPEAKNIIPSSFLLGAKAVGNPAIKLPEEYYLTAGERWARRGKDLLTMEPLKKFAELNYKAVNAGDNIWRMAAASKFMLDEMGPAVGKGAKLVDRMLSLSVRMDALKEGFNDAAKSEKILKEVKAVMGDYEKERSTAGHWLSDTIMFWPWMEHAWSFTSRIPFDTPLKTAVTTSLTNAAARELQRGEIPNHMKRLGAVPVRNPDGTQAKDENGMPLVMLKPGVTPFLQTPDNIRQAFGTIAPSLGFRVPEEDLTGLTLNPFARMLAWLFFNVKPGGADYVDPRMTEYGPGFVRRDTVQKMMETGQPPSDSEIIKHPKPNFVSALGMTLMPREWLLAARLYEDQKGGVPSDFTIPGVERAPKRLQFGVKQKPLPMAEYLLGLGRFAPTQTTHTAEDEAAIDATRMKKSLKKFFISTSQENE